jgi:arsenate reductase (thioredoxin)
MTGWMAFQPEFPRAGLVQSAADLSSYLDERTAEFDQIEPARRESLEAVAGYIRLCQAESREARLVFICTHNSRRSQLAQVWSAIAAQRHGLDHVRTFSGGTEATAFNPNVVVALERAGLTVTAALSSSDNPVYLIGGDDGLLQACFSKQYASAPNPTGQFCAIFACTSADEACPTVSGSELRISLPYADPKSSDNTDSESATYDARTAQICREMLYLMSRAASVE